MDALPTPGELTLRRLLEPFAAAMALEDTREIVVTRPGSFGVEGDRGWTWHGDERLTYRWLDALGRLAGRMTHQDLSGASPACSSRLPGGQRITINMPPMMPEGLIQLTIRQRAKSFDPSLDWLEARGWFRWTEGRTHGGTPFQPAEGWTEWLRTKVRGRANIVLLGSIGSSKTTGAEALIKEIPDWERLGTLESTPEWELDRRNWAPIRYAQEKKPGIGLPTAEEALEMALRMRLDRVLFGELRNAEAWAWLRSLQTGLRGAIATAHGHPGFEGLFRALHPMIRQSPHSAAMDEATLRAMIHANIDVVLHCARVDEANAGVPYRCLHIEDVRAP